MARNFIIHARAMLVLGLPLIGSHLAQMSLHVSDTMLLGRYGVNALAAVTVAGSAFFVVFIFGSGFAQAIMPLIAAALGRGDEVEVRRDARMGLWLSLVYGLATYPLFWTSGQWLRAMGQAPEVAQLGQDFLRIAGAGMVPALLVMALKSYLSALGKAQVVLWVTLGALVLNLALGWALIFGHWGAPELGVRGAAISTLTVQWATFLSLGFYAQFQRELHRFRLFSRFWRADYVAMGRVFRLGWPIGVTGLMESGLFSGASLMMGWVGTVPLAAHGIAMQVAALAFMVHLGLSNAATVLAGRAEGAGDIKAMREIAVTAIGLSAGLCAVGIVIFLSLPVPIISLFLDMSKPDAAQILATGTGLLALAALFQLGDAMQVMALGLLRAIRDTRVPMWAAAFSYWGIGIPCSYVLGFPMGLGAQGIWLGLCVGLLFASTSLMLRFWGKAPKAAVQAGVIVASSA
jgi:MATE family multidrug resistance protein